MDFLDRLKILMQENKDNNSTLAKKSGIPYTTIDGLFKRGWEKAQISTIQRICDFYGVSLDYMVYGAEKLSATSLLVAAAYENASDYGKAVIDFIITQERIHKRNIQVFTRTPEGMVPEIVAVHDSDLYARYNARREQEELQILRETPEESE